MLNVIERWLPAICVVCQSAVGAPNWLCGSCDKAVVCNRSCCPLCSEPITTLGTCQSCGNRGVAHLDRVVCPLIYTGVITQLIHKWKFEGGSELTSFLVKRALWADEKAATPRPSSNDNLLPPSVHLQPELGSAPLHHYHWHGLVPIPMGLWRRVVRGYNQSALLAQALRTHLPDTCAPPVRYQLLKDRGGSAQHRLQRRARSENRRRRYHAQQPVVGQHLLLIDDVVTTGATLSAAAAELRAAGAASVSAWALARTPAPQWQQV